MCHESAGLTLDRYGHLYGSGVEAVGVAINALLARECGQGVGSEPIPASVADAINPVDVQFVLWSLGESNS